MWLHLLTLAGIGVFLYTQRKIMTQVQDTVAKIDALTADQLATKTAVVTLVAEVVKVGTEIDALLALVGSSTGVPQSILDAVERAVAATADLKTATTSLQGAVKAIDDKNPDATPAPNASGGGGEEPPTVPV